MRKHAQTPKRARSPGFFLSSNPATRAQGRAEALIQEPGTDSGRARRSGSGLGSLGDRDCVCSASRSTAGIGCVGFFFFFLVRNKCSGVCKAPGSPEASKAPRMRAGGKKSWGAGEGKGAKPREVAARAWSLPRRLFARLCLSVLPAGLCGIDEFIFLLPLHAAVLEPDLDLALGEAERVGYFDAAAPRQVAVEVELLLQLQRLVARVGLAASAPVTPIHSTCGQKWPDASKPGSRQPDQSALSPAPWSRGWKPPTSPTMSGARKRTGWEIISYQARYFPPKTTWSGK